MGGKGENGKRIQIETREVKEEPYSSPSQQLRVLNEAIYNIMVGGQSYKIRNPFSYQGRFIYTNLLKETVWKPRRPRKVDSSTAHMQLILDTITGGSMKQTVIDRIIGIISPKSRY